MLLGVDPLLSPDLLHVLASAGHGDRIAIVDANFPAATNARRLVRIPGTDAGAVLRAVLTVLPLDDFEPDAVLVMQVVGEPEAVPEVVAEFAQTLCTAGAGAPRAIPRRDFYTVTRDAFAVVATGERRLYGNIVLTKGVVR